MSIVDTVLEIIKEFVIANIEAYGLPMIFLLMTLESALIPIPSEVTMPFGGFLSAEGKLNFWAVVFAGAFGNLIGSLMAYYLGYYGGRPLVIKYGKYILMPEKKLHAAERFFERYGEAAVLVSRNLPVIRTFISLPVGVAEMNIYKFSIYTFLGSIPWCIGLTYLGVVLGNNWESLRGYFHNIDYVIIAVIIIAVVYYIVHNLKNRANNGGNGSTDES